MELQSFERYFDGNVEVEVVEQSSERISLSYRVASPDQYDLSSPGGTGLFMQDLWKHSCFELFEFDSKSKQYAEWNFSSRMNFWGAIFSDYRKMKSLIEETDLISIKADFKSDEFSLDVSIRPSFENSKLQPTVILVCKDKRRFHLAGEHPGKKPDFHLKWA